MITVIVLVIVGIAIIVACRAYVREPVLRTIGVCAGAACIIIAAYLLIVDVLHVSTDTHHLDMPTHTLTT